MIARARLGSYRARLTPFFDTRARAAFASLAAPVPCAPAAAYRQILAYALFAEIQIKRFLGGSRA